MSKDRCRGFFGGRARTRFRTVPYGTFGAGPAALALEATVERISPALAPDGSVRAWRSLQRDDIMVWYKPEPAFKLLVILDTSLSMGGAHRGVAAVMVLSWLGRLQAVAWRSWPFTRSRK